MIYSNPQLTGIEINRGDIEIMAGTTVSSLEDTQSSIGVNVLPLVPNPNSLIMIAFDKASDLSQIINALNQFSNGDYHTHLAIRNVIEQPDVNGNTYSEGEIHIMGHNILPDDTVEVKTVFTNIKFYKKNG